MSMNSPRYSSPPRRGNGGRGGSPPSSPPPTRRGYGGGGGRGRRRENNTGSLMVRNIPPHCQRGQIRIQFEQFGPVLSVHVPKDYNTGRPRGFAFVQFVDPRDAFEAQLYMNNKNFYGRHISVIEATDTRKRPEEMHHRTSRFRGSENYGGRTSSHNGRSRSRSSSRPCHSGSRKRYQSRRKSDDSVSPRRPAEHPRSPRNLPRERDGDQKRRSFSPGNGNGADQNTRKRPEEMRHRASRLRGSENYGGRRSSHYGRSRSRSRSRPCHSGFGKRYQSRRKSDYSVSPRRRAEHPRSPKNLPRDRDGDEKGRSFSPDNGNGADQNPSNGCAEKAIHMSEADRGKQKSSPSRASKSPQESR